MLRLNAYTVLADTDDLYSSSSVLPTKEGTEARMLQTHYEKQWLDRGMTIKYLAWNLQHKTDFQEPEIEIEKDTYRSYGRNYVSPTNH